MHHDARLQLEEAQHHNASLQSEVVRLESLLHDQRVLNEELASSLSEVLKRVTVKDKQGQDQGQEIARSAVAISLLQKERNDLQEQHTALQMQHVELETHYKELTQKLGEGAEMHQENASKVEALHEHVLQLQQSAQAAEATLSAERKARQAAEAKNRQVQESAAADLLKLRGQHVSVAGEVVHWQEAAKQAKAELQAVRQALEDARAEAQAAQERAAYAEGAGVETQRRADLLQEKATSLATDLVDTQQERDQLQAVVASFAGAQPAAAAATAAFYTKNTAAFAANPVLNKPGPGDLALGAGAVAGLGAQVYSRANNGGATTPASGFISPRQYTSSAMTKSASGQVCGAPACARSRSCYSPYTISRICFPTRLL